MKKSQSRRDFLRVSAIGALGTVILSKNGFSADKQSGFAESGTQTGDLKKFGIGLQLYTIRDAMVKDVPGSLKKVSDAGYKYVELAGYSDGKFYGYAPADFKKLVNDLGMEVLSSHTQVEAQGVTLENAQKMAEDHVKVGAKYCIQPWVVEEARTTIDSWKKMVADWNKVGAIMKKQGLEFGYHNHNFEFGNVQGKVPFFDIMMPELDKNLVFNELDLFWTTKAGQDPVEIIKKYPGRFKFFHMKDMYTKQAPSFTTVGVKDFAPVGEGIIDFKRILAVKNIAGLKYLIVEQDLSRDGDMFADIRKSIVNLTTKILV